MAKDRKEYWKGYYRKHREGTLARIREYRKKQKDAGIIRPKRKKIELTPFENKLRRVLGIGRGAAKRMASELDAHPPSPRGKDDPHGR